MKRIASLICCLLSLSTLANAADIESRSATQQEADSFNRFYIQHHPESAGMNINFLVTRATPKKPWEIRASVMVGPAHGYKNLCKQTNENFEFDAAHGWHEDGAQPVKHTVWLDQGKDCRAAAGVELDTPLPDVEVIDMLRHGDAILKQSYILLRGNTNCSLVYLQGLKFVGIGTAAVGHEEMYSFRYVGEQRIPVALSVRKLGNEYTTWDMHCPIP
ncbi:MAG TPA: hypothetical protein VF472_01870 [Burkholderiaceae bacterium]